MADKNMSQEIINLALTIDQINALLAVLGNAPFVQSANLINEIQAQGAPQFEKIKTEYDALPKDAEIIEETKSA